MMSEGSFVGTRGMKLRLEGFAIRITGDSANSYDIFYQFYLQGLGESRVYKNGEFCGTRVKHEDSRV